MKVIFISGIFMSFFIAFLLLTKKPKVLIDKILATWIIIIGIHLLGYLFNQLGYWQKYPHLIGITAPIPLFHGPMLYLYSRYALRKDRKLRPSDYLHFAPGIAAYLYMMKFFFSYTSQEKIMIDSGATDDFSIFSVVLLMAILISGLAYSIVSYNLTVKHKQKIENHFSFHEGISLNWLRYCILSIGLVFLTAAIVFILRDIVGVQFPFNPEYIFYIIMIGFIFYIGYFGIKHENIFVNNPSVDISSNKQKQVSEKYRNTGMKKDLAEKLFEKLLSIMDHEKPYLDPRLKLSTLAGQLDISANQLSQIINQEAGVNFHDFINKYRVEEFLKNARENKNYSFLALALDSGFNSKSSFNYIFKKQKGVSPSRYLVQQDIEQKQA